jgi:drug/metabolite transporter (DMT)-like permease
MQSDNARGIVLLITAMAFFATTDSLIKLASADLTRGQVLFSLGMGGGLIFAGLTLAAGKPVFARDFFRPGMVLRNAAEVTATFSFITALATVGLSMASAIIQAMPLTVTLVAIVLLGEKVGWRRWGAILAGFAGVLIILRPGFSGFDPNALWAVVALVALSLRDVSTRLAPAATPSTRIAFYGMLANGVAGAIHMALLEPPHAASPTAMLQMGIAVLTGAAGYYAMVAAMRVGEISSVAPFRYSRILFALAIGYTVFGERPDMLTYLGASITVAAGVYAFWREARLARKQMRKGNP